MFVIPEASAGLIEEAFTPTLCATNEISAEAVEKLTALAMQSIV